VTILSSHKARPYSVCRHPDHDVHGATVLAALFDLNARRLRLYDEQPCRGHAEDFSIW